MTRRRTTTPVSPGSAGSRLVYELRHTDGDLEIVVLPVRGLGLWGMLYGFVALDADLDTIRGLTFYEHKETPGLGGEVDNPRWKALWPGREGVRRSRTARVIASCVKWTCVGPPEEAAPHRRRMASRAQP